MPDSNDKLRKKWVTDASKLLLGRKIVGVRYMTAAEVIAHGWGRYAIVLVLDNGLAIYPSSDDEGNNAGAMFTTDNKTPVIPVI